MISDNDRKREDQRKKLKIFSKDNFNKTPSEVKLEEDLLDYKEIDVKGLEKYDKKLEKNIVEFLEPHQEFQISVFIYLFYAVTIERTHLNHLQ